MAVETSMTRFADLQVFYGLMNRLLEAQGGPMSLAAVTSSSVAREVCISSSSRGNSAPTAVKGNGSFALGRMG